MSKSPDEGFDMLCDMALNNGQWGSDRGSRKSSVVNSIDSMAFSKMASQVDALNKKMDEMQSPPKKEALVQSFYEPRE